MRLKTAIFAATSALVLYACGPVSFYHKPGVEVARMQRDQTECQVRALKDAPVANQVQRGAPVYYPGRRICSAGSCYTHGGYWLPGPVYSVDTNEGLRNRVEAQCMADLGYAPVSLPRCQSSTAHSVPVGVTTTLPALTANSCVIRNQNGTYQIVNAG